MEGGETLSFAKVKVEYHDPSGVFPIVSNQLEGRLPLRNLHWKSPSRPLRSIESLHVELTKGSGDAGSGGKPDRPASGDLTPAVKERRHQMPGLSDTPYLKLYLLRCDDADAYKSTYRKAIREWLKIHTPASQSSSKKNAQENHDAYEWMILHVVLPNTNAAKEPINSAAASKTETGETKDSKGSKFLNRSSSTLLEKLKADFNVSGKHAPDRIAQIRLSNDDLQHSQTPPQTLTRVSSAAQEQMEAWDDVIAKLKALILASFTLRVGQYEEDIREKDSQRSLPGWNFCTFFVLKEGLARGFERVGLLDDTLAGYEELSTDLDNLLSNKATAGPMDSFIPGTEELKKLFEKAQDSSTAEGFMWSSGNRPISSVRKPFRELILANNVSIYDFKIYVLARKMEILNRMCYAAQGTEDLIPLGQMCQLGSAEIPSLSRIVREDVSQISNKASPDESQAIVDNIVDSWTYAAAQQILDETNTTYLSQSNPTQTSFSSILKDKPSSYPSRKSSLPPPSPQDKPDDAQSLFDRLQGRLSSGPTQGKSGKDYLAMQRAQLVLLQRRILENLGAKHGLSVGWVEARKHLAGGSKLKLTDISLNEEDEEGTEDSESPAESSEVTLDGIYHQTLSQALVSKSNLLRSFEKLTISALELYFTAGHGKSFERMLADLAVLKFQLGDYAAASNFFARVAPIYSQFHWGLIETEMLLMHAKCLKVLNRKDDYVRMLLGLLAKAISKKVTDKISTTLDDYDIEGSAIDGKPLLPELLGYSAQLPYEVPVEMGSYFTGLNIEPYITHLDDGQGFQMSAKFRSHFNQQIKIDKAKIILVSPEGSTQEIALESDSSFETKSGINSIIMRCAVTTFGLYTIQRFSLTANKIVFIHEYHSSENSLTEMPYAAENHSKGPKVLVYPSSSSLEVHLSTSRVIHIDQVRCLEIRCINGPTNLSNAEIRLKPLSSGLRLRTADVKKASGNAKISSKATQGAIALVDFQAEDLVTLVIPYELDDSHHEIAIKIEVISNKPSLEYSTVQTVVADLALDVNVHDLFKLTHIFSRFHVRTPTELPFKILKIKLDESNAYIVETSPQPTMPTVVYPKQPATFMYKIRPANTTTTGSYPRRKSADQEAALKLNVDYQCIDEIITAAILSRFAHDVSETRFKSLERFLVKIVMERLAVLFTPSQMTEFTMLDEITVPSFEEMGWNALTADLPISITMDLCEWLRIWHETCLTIDFPSHNVSNSFQIRDIAFAPRSIIISVPLPRVHILYSAKLIIQLPFPDPVPVGHALATTLFLKHTRHWDHVSEESDIEDIEFMYDVDAPADIWLIGGPRRGRFFAKEGETKQCDIVLIPLRTGNLMLPNVDVRPVGKEPDEISCETEFTSMGTSILVVGDLKRTTIAMSSNEAVIVSADRRT